MNPRKPWKLVQQTADELSVDPLLVSDLIHMYWKKVRNALTNLEHIRVRVENLGTFTLRANKLKKYIKNLDKKMEDVDQSSFSGYKQYEEMSERLQLLRDTMEKFETEWSERKEHYETRRKTD